MLLRALGTEQTVDLDVKTLVLEQGDQMLLCSDGLSNKVSHEQLKHILHADGEIEKKRASSSSNSPMTVVERIILRL
ncbi:hypothetical protein GCM10020331_047260 [Ectobacillus funiculus]